MVNECCDLGPRLRTQGAPAGLGKWGEKGPPPHLHSALQALEQLLLKGTGGSPQGLLQLSKAFWELGQKVSPGEGEGLAPLMRPTKFPEIPVSLERNTEVFRHPLL